MQLQLIFAAYIYYYLKPLSANPQNGQTHSNNSTAVDNELFECV